MSEVIDLLEYMRTAPQNVKWIGLVGLTYLGFTWADKSLVNERGQAAFARYAYRLDAREGLEEDEPEWPEIFLQWFDAMFKVRMRRVRLLDITVPLPSFARSAIASFIVALFASIAWAVSTDVSISRVRPSDAARYVAAYGLAVVATNVIPDYLSLIETRFIILLISKTRSVVIRAVLIMADFLFTLGIVVSFGLLTLFAMIRWANPDITQHIQASDVDLDLIGEFLTSGALWRSPPGTINFDVIGIYLYTSFFTSIWLWIYLSAALLSRLATALEPVRSVLRTYFFSPKRTFRTLILPAALLEFGAYNGLAMLDPVPKWDVYVMERDVSWIADPEAREAARKAANAEPDRLRAQLTEQHVRVFDPSDPKLRAMKPEEILARSRWLVGDMNPNLMARYHAEIACGRRPYATWIHGYDATQVLARVNGRYPTLLPAQLRFFRGSDRPPLPDCPK